MSDTRQGAVYLGGFGSTERQTRYTADGIARYYDLAPNDIESFSFVTARNNPKLIGDAITDASVISHSAGILAIAGDRPVNDLISIAPPLPTGRRQLLARATLKGLRMEGALCLTPESRQVARMGVSQARETLRHPVINLRALGAIATCDALELATGVAIKSPVEDAVRIGFMSRDIFRFHPSHHDEAALDEDSRMKVTTINGGHDRFILDPQGVLEELGVSSSVFTV